MIGRPVPASDKGIARLSGAGTENFAGPATKARF